MLSWKLVPVAASRSSLPSLGRKRFLSTAIPALSDHVNPAATSRTSTDPHVPVILQMEPSGEMSRPPMCVQTLLRTSAEAGPDTPALSVTRGGKKIEWNYAQYYESVRDAAKGFIACGLGDKRGVGVMAFNSPELIFSLLGGIFAGGLSCGIYVSSSGETVSYLSNHTPFDLLLVEDEDMLKTILANRTVKEAFPTVKKIILLAPQQPANPSEDINSKTVITWEEMIAAGRNISGTCLDEIEARQFVNEACMLLFTSGTTGTPKGVMFSHDNITYASFFSSKTHGWHEETEQLSSLSFLPMGHLAAILMDVFAMITVKGKTHCADRNALRGTLVDNLKEVRPTKFFAVPRLWEKFSERILEAEQNSSWPRRTLLRWARAQTLQNSNAILDEVQKGVPYKPTLSYKLAHRLVISKIHEALGLDGGVAKLENCSVGAAPTPPTTIEFLKSIGFIPVEVYGSSEVSGPSTANTKHNILLGTVGQNYLGTEVKIYDPDPAAGGEGEIICRGRNIFMGYIWEKEKTDKAFLDKDQLWYRTGDIGRMDSDGYLTVTGRLKELIITAGGKNISPIALEDNIRAELSDIIGNVVVVGDHRKYLTGLITIKVLPDPKTMQPTDNLDPGAVKWCEERGVKGLKTVQDFFASEKKQLLLDGIQQGIERANLKAPSNPSKVQKFTVLPAELSIAGGELGPTLKLKRFYVAKKYEKVIDAMYES